MKTPIKRNYRYLLKCVLPVFALAGAMIGCEKEASKPVNPVKVLRFGEKIGIDSIEYNNVMKYATNPDIKKIIYFVDSVPYNNNNMGAYEREKISAYRQALQERLDYTSKATGAGTYIFRRGVASVEDSLWFVANGWKIKIW